MVAVAILLVFYLAGVLISDLTGNFIPGSIIGMVLLFCALKFKIIQAEKVRHAARFFLNNMAIFFIPVAVGLMTAYSIISEHIVAIITSTIISTILVIASVGYTMQWMERRRK